MKIFLDWSLDGLRWALRQGHIVIIDDTLRFSTTVVTATQRGFVIYPVSHHGQGIDFAASIGAAFAAKEGRGKYSLSPWSFLREEPMETKDVVLYSPNGAACAELVGKGDIALIGCLLNAEAVGRAATRLAEETGRDVTLIAAGEQRDLENGQRVMYERKPAWRIFAIEDYLGCGAILSSMSLTKSAEAAGCELMFNACKGIVKELMLDSFSGQYLVNHRRKKDVEHASRLNLYNAVPVIRDRRIERLTDTDLV
jgi:2-phosphosulfolactate phosphatase